MKIVNFNTAQGRKLLAIASQYDASYLEQIYNRPSAAKRQAYWDCKALCDDEGGEGFSIVSHNTFGFSVSWVAGKTVRLITPKNDYLIICEEKEV